MNEAVFELLCSSVSMRRTARLLGINPKTVARKLHFLAAVEGEKNRRTVEEYAARNPVTDVFFDDVETSHHTKCKPLSIPLAVNEKRLILGFCVCLMPASGKLAALSRKKYGPRPDHRPQAIQELLESIRPLVHPCNSKIEFTSDQCPRYPGPVRRIYPGATHRRVKGRRGCVAGQGELKKIGFDPLFALNHSAAMLRANVNRLIRRTWCTTKRIDSLVAHLTLYVAYHNRQLQLS